jgi:hypothetical protein
VMAVCRPDDSQNEQHHHAAPLPHARMQLSSSAAHPSSILNIDHGRAVRFGLPGVELPEEMSTTTALFGDTIYSGGTNGKDRQGLARRGTIRICVPHGPGLPARPK